MTLTPLYIIPGLIFLFWAVVHSLLVYRTNTYQILCLMLITGFLTATGDVVLGEILGSEALAILVVQLMAPAIIPLACIYFAKLCNSYHHRPPLLVLWIVAPVMLFTASLIITSVYGLDRTDAFLERLRFGEKGDRLFLNSAEHIYYNCNVIAFRIVMVLETLFMLAYCTQLAIRFRFRPANWRDFFLRKRRMRVLEIQVSLALVILTGLCIKIFLHHPIMRGAPGWMDILVVLLCVFQFFFGFFALFGAREFISLADIHNSFRFNYDASNCSQVSEEVILDMMGQLNGESLTHVLSRLEVQAGAEFPGRNIGRPKTPSLRSAIMGPAPLPHEEESLFVRFQHLMMDEQLFLQPSLTLADVASRLHTNKTYVSKMVNQNYNLGFPEVLNILRVDYAEQFIRKHKDATQEEIAKACGFLSASSFNSTFKRITGFTPKVWAARTVNGEK